MEIHMKMLVSLLCLLVVEFKLCGGTRQVPQNNNDLFIAQQNPSAFDPDLNMVMASAGSSATDSKVVGDETRVPCEGGEMKLWGASANNATGDKDLTFRFKENRTGGDEMKEEVVYNVLPKGPVTPSGPGHRGNAVVTGQGLSGSKRNRPVGPMPINNKADSRQSGGAGHMQNQLVSHKRSINSGPSPGGGH